MIRICRIGLRWFGINIDVIGFEDDFENIKIFAEEGTPVMICEDIETAEEILGEEVEIVD